MGGEGGVEAAAGPTNNADMGSFHSGICGLYCHRHTLHDELWYTYTEKERGRETGRETEGETDKQR